MPKISAGNIDYNVWVEDSESQRSITREDIENLVIATPHGQLPLKDIASVEAATGYKAIRREIQQRTLTVRAS